MMIGRQNRSISNIMSPRKGDLAHMSAVPLGVYLVLAAAASAQTEMVPIEGRAATHAEAAFERAVTANLMKCTIKPSAPTLDYSLQYDAGFRLVFPLDPTRGPSGMLNVFLRMRSAGAGEKPIYLAARYDVPGGPHEDDGMLTGRFGAAAGTWRIEALAIDSIGRVCRADWRAEIKRSPAPARADSHLPLRRLAILVDAAPVHSAYGQFPPQDREMFIGSLSSLLQFIPANSTRLVVFNLEQSKELYRSDGFEPAALNEIREKLQAIGGGTVDYAALQKSPLASEFLAGLIDREMRDSDRADLVVFMGPAVPDQVPLGNYALTGDSPHPVFGYLQLRPARNVNAGPGCPGINSVTGGPPCPPRMAQVRLPTFVVQDAISQAIGKLRGVTFVVSDPSELAKPLRDLAHRTQAHGAKR